MEALKTLGYLLLAAGVLILIYEMYMIIYNGVNPFQ